MSVSSYEQISVLTGATSPAVAVNVANSNIGVQVTPAAGGSAKLQYSLFATPGENDWIDWMQGTITATKCIAMDPSIRNIRLVSISGAATAAISGRSI